MFKFQSIFQLLQELGRDVSWLNFSTGTVKFQLSSRDLRDFATSIWYPLIYVTFQLEICKICERLGPTRFVFLDQHCSWHSESLHSKGTGKVSQYVWLCSPALWFQSWWKLSTFFFHIYLTLMGLEQIKFAKHQPLKQYLCNMNSTNHFM